MPKLKIYPDQSQLKPADSFLNILKPFWILGAICGIHQHNAEIFPGNLKGKLARALYVLTEHTLLLSCLFVQLKGVASTNHFLKNFTWLLIFGSEFSIGVTALMSCTVQQKYFLLLKENFGKAERKARQLPLWVSYGKLRICGWAILIVLAVEWTIFLVVDMRFCNLGFQGCLQSWYFHTFPSKIYVVYVLIFCLYLLTVRQIMSVANANLEYIWQTSLPVRYFIRYERTLDDIEKLLLELSNIYRLMKELYRMPVLLIFFNIQIDIFTSMYLILEENFNKHRDVNRLLAFTVQHTFILFFLCAVGQSVISEFNDVLLNVHTIAINENGLLRSKISSFIRHLNVDDFKLSACDVFALDSCLIKRIISTVSFYLILLIQLDTLLNKPSF